MNTLDLIIEKAKKYNVSAYEISKHTSITEPGARNILKGRIKKPQKSTLDVILNYLMNVEEKREGYKVDIIEESLNEYVTKSNKEQKYYIEMLDKIPKSEIVKYIILNERSFRKNKSYNLFIKDKIKDGVIEELVKKIKGSEY